jgi:ketosteroid isomerase-like protein
MHTGDNKRLLQRIFDRLADGDSKLFLDSMAEDFTWTVTGTNSWSGTYAGKTAVLEELLQPLRRKVTDRVRTIPQRFLADGDHVVVEAQGRSTTCAGAAYDNRYCFVFRLEHGKLVHVTEYMDTELVSAVLGERSSG